MIRIKDCLIYSNGKGVWSKDSILVHAESIVPLVKNFQTHMGCSPVSADMVYMEKYYTMDYVVEGNTMRIKGLATLIWTKHPTTHGK